MEQYFEVWLDGQLVGIYPGIVSDEFPGVVAFEPEWDIRAGDKLVPLLIDRPSSTVL